MWQILKGELEYNRYVLIGVYTLALVAFAVVMVRDCCGGVYSVVPNTIIIFYVGYAFLCKTSCKESRFRQHCMLPRSQTEYGVTRMLFFAIVQGGIVLLWLIAYIRHIGDTPEAIWMILTANALMLTFRAVGFIYEDTKSRIAPMGSSAGWSAEGIAHRALGFVTYLVIIVMLLITAAGESDDIAALMVINVDWRPMLELRDFLRSPMGALAANVLLMLTFYLSATFSLPRRSLASSR